MKTLGIVTRCHPDRPNMLQICINSVKGQSCNDYIHLFIKDDKGIGVKGANKLLKGVNIPSVQYVMVLDDDDFLISPSFVEDFASFVKNKPDVVIMRGIVGGNGMLPSDKAWQKPLKRGSIGSFCFAVCKKLWEQNISAWGGTDNFAIMGDFSFINKCFHEATTIYWMDKVVAATQRISRGASEPKQKEKSDGCE